MAKDTKKDAKLVSSLSVMFKKKTTEVPTDITEAKSLHRKGIKSLIDKYYEDVDAGKAEGIRNAKELVEVMKMDMLLMGEATERTETGTNIDEVKLTKFSQNLEQEIDGNEDMQAIVNSIFSQLNGYNDEQDDAPKFGGELPMESPDVVVYSNDKEQVLKEIEQQNTAVIDSIKQEENKIVTGDTEYTFV